MGNIIILLLVCLGINFIKGMSKTIISKDLKFFIDAFYISAYYNSGRYLFQIIDLEANYSVSINDNIEHNTDISLVKANVSLLTPAKEICIANEFSVNFYLNNTLVSPIREVYMFFIPSANYLNHNIGSSLAFGHNYIRAHQSLSYLLKEQGYIDKNAFSFIMHNNNSGQLIFGDIPSKTIEQYPYNMTRPLYDSNSLYWEVMIEYISVNERKFDKKHIARFTSKGATMKVPDDVLEFITEEMFGDAIGKRISKKAKIYLRR